MVCFRNNRVVCGLVVFGSLVAGSVHQPAHGEHWAYVAPQRPDRPAVENAEWTQNEIDYFVLSELERRGLEPSPPAADATLVRRLYFDLTGLPPSPQEVDAYLADDSPDAYERLVELLLRSEAHAERMTTWWLDMARYADTHGYEGDGSRNIWLYRDWVIHAFRHGMPFDQFTIEQLAGDLLPDATVDQRIATGFHRNSPFCYEAGTDLEQFRVESVVDRVNTTMTVWMGTTMGCAQCHEHKYDPFSQVEYYQLYAFFNDSAETDGGAGQLSAYSPLRRAEAATNEAQLAELRAALTTETPELVEAQQAWEAAFARDESWQVFVPAQHVSLEGATLDRLEDDSILVSGANPEHDVYELTTRWTGGDVVALGMEVLKHESLPHGGPGRYEANGNFGLSHIDLEYALSESRQQTWHAIKFKEAYASYEEGGDTIGGAIDDDELSNWCTNQNEAHAVFVADQSYFIPAGAILRLRMRHDSQWDRHGVGRFRFSVASQLKTGGVELSGLVPFPLLQTLASPVEQRDATQRAELAKYFRSVTPLLEPVRQQIAQLEANMSQATTLVMVERDEPRETRRFIRGSFLDPAEVVQPGIPQAWHDWPPDAPLNRLGLAGWLVHPDNPLTARVTMNRIWTMLFGKGIVRTSEDFGIQGSLPSHPQLLDYLATRLVTSGWDLRAVQKEIVSSATYRQSSHVTPDRLERDPENVYFSRGPAFRLDAEMIRDNALAISGLLTRRLGGPGVYPYQPPGVYEQIHSFTTKWETSTDGDQFRRGLYTWWKRTAPYPSMITFDAPRRNVCVERRPRTNTPLQALVTLNDPVFVQCSVALGQRMATEFDGDVKQRITAGMRWCVARVPTGAEVDQLAELYAENLAIYEQDPDAADKVVQANSTEDQIGEVSENVSVAELAAWSVVGNVLLNLDETLTKY